MKRNSGIRESISERAILFTSKLFRPAALLKESDLVDKVCVACSSLKINEHSNHGIRAVFTLLFGIKRSANLPTSTFSQLKSTVR